MDKKQEMELDYLYFLLDRDRTTERAGKTKVVQLDIKITKDMIKQGYLPFSFNQYNNILRLTKKALPKKVANTLKEMNPYNEIQVLNAPKRLEFCNGNNKFKLMCNHLQKSIRKQE